MHRRLPCRPAGRIALALSLLGFALQTSTLAGPLEPPPGPVAPTHKTLTEVEPRTPISSLPFIINEPGSYYVTGNLTSVDGLGIVINAPNVTLDLMGHTLTGGEGSSAAVASTALGVNPTVKNGRVTGWGTAAISVTGAHLFDLEAVDNRSAGFSIGSDSVVSRCTARSNGGHGFVGSVRNTIESCTSHDNDGHGFSLSTSSSIRFCTAPPTRPADSRSAAPAPSASAPPPPTRPTDSTPASPAPCTTARRRPTPSTASTPPPAAASNAASPRGTDATGSPSAPAPPS